MHGAVPAADRRWRYQKRENNSRLQTVQPQTETQTDRQGEGPNKKKGRAVMSVNVASSRDGHVEGVCVTCLCEPGRLFIVFVSKSISNTRTH